MSYPQGSLDAPCLVLDGASLALCVAHQQRLFMEVACAAPTVICCRCAPTQKAELCALLRRTKPKACVAAIGDGGNDVGMIQAAHVGIGVEGREGRQAAMAAEFSIREFSHLGRLVPSLPPRTLPYTPQGHGEAMLTHVGAPRDGVTKSEVWGGKDNDSLIAHVRCCGCGEERKTEDDGFVRVTEEPKRADRRREAQTVGEERIEARRRG